MAEGERYCVLGYAETEGERSPRVTCVVSRERGMELTEAAVHASHEIAVVLHSLTEGEQQRGTTPAVYYLPRFGRHEDGIEAVRLATVELDTAFMHAVSGEREQVTDVYAKEAEGEAKAIHITLLPRKHREGEERTQLFNREVTLGSFLRTDLELAEGVKGCHFLVDGIVEHSANVTQVYVAGIDRRGLLGEMDEKGLQPVARDGREAEGRGGGLKLTDAPPRGIVYFTCAGIPEPFDVLLESVGECHGFRFIRGLSGENEVTQLLCRAVGTEGRGHDDGLHEAVIIAEAVKEVIVDKITVGTDTDTGAHTVPFLRAHGLRKGYISRGATMVDRNADDRRAVSLGTACVEI